MTSKSVMLTMLYPPDGGLIYKETNLHHLFPEPLNMISSILFLIPAFYWLIKLKGFNRQYAFLSVCAWLLLIGCIGGTVYHGFRRWHIFIMMDWMPIALLCLMASVYFWVKFSGSTVLSILALVIFVTVVMGMRAVISRHDIQLGININYSVMVLMIVLPLLLLLYKLRWKNGWMVLCALLSFVVAISFRIDDKYTTWATGTHFLWHTFGVIATALMFAFIYRVSRLPQL